MNAAEAPWQNLTRKSRRLGAAGRRSTTGRRPTGRRIFPARFRLAPLGHSGVKPKLTPALWAVKVAAMLVGHKATGDSRPLLSGGNKAPLSLVSAKTGSSLARLDN